MKAIIAAAVLILAFSIPAHAQAHMQAAGGGADINRATGGGGATGGGTSGGSVSFHTPLYIPTREFQMTAVSGSSDYVPSTYVAYDKALTAGQTSIGTKPPTIVEVAQTNKQTKAPDSEYVIVQDKQGNLVEESRK